MSSNPAEGLGARIKEARQARGWTQAELGKAVGVSKSAVSQWEKGAVQNLKLGNLFAAGRVLNKDIRELVFGKAQSQVAETVASTAVADMPPSRLALLQTYDALPKDVQAHLRALIFSLGKSHRTSE